MFDSHAMNTPGSGAVRFCRSASVSAPPQLFVSPERRESSAFLCDCRNAESASALRSAVNSVRFESSQSDAEKRAERIASGCPG